MNAHVLAAPTLSYRIDPGVRAALADFTLPDRLGFGLVAAPLIFRAEYCNGKWTAGEWLPYGAIEILPGARALHYAEVVFEGLEAYRVGSASLPNLFRPKENWRRFSRSGTAAIVSPLGVIADPQRGEHVPRHVDAVAAELREALLAIQQRRAPDLFRWTRTVPHWATPS